MTSTPVAIADKEPFDSEASTRAHIMRVAELMGLCQTHLQARLMRHIQHLVSEENDVNDEAVPVAVSVTLLTTMIEILRHRGVTHDASKLTAPEKAHFDKATPALASTTYGSQEYNSAKAMLDGGLRHHYRENSYHPEHYSNGVWGMCWFDVIEMLMDWKAASERHDDGNLIESIKYNKERFSLDNTFVSLLSATAQNMGLISGNPINALTLFDLADGLVASNTQHLIMAEPRQPTLEKVMTKMGIRGQVWQVMKNTFSTIDNASPDPAPEPQKEAQPLGANPTQRSKLDLIGTDGNKITN